MKTASKVFIWIGMVLTFYLIFPIVVGVLALTKIGEAKSKEELKTMGILTALFCSTLGGIFMLCIKDEELTPKTDMTAMFHYTPTPQPQPKPQAFAQAEQTPPIATAPKEKASVKLDTPRDLFRAMSIFTMLILSVILIGLSYAFDGMYTLYEAGGLPIIISLVQTALIAVVFVFYIWDTHRFRKPILVLQCVFAAVSVVQVIFSLIAMDAGGLWADFTYTDTDTTYTLYSSYSYYNKQYYYALGSTPTTKDKWSGTTIFYDADLYIISAVIAFILVALAIAVIVLQLKEPKETESTVAANTKASSPVEATPQPQHQPKKASPMEYELTEIKRLLDAAIITEEEHQKMRASIIAKYF